MGGSREDHPAARRVKNNKNAPREISSLAGLKAKGRGGTAGWAARGEFSKLGGLRLIGSTEKKKPPKKNSGDICRSDRVFQGEGNRGSKTRGAGGKEPQRRGGSRQNQGRRDAKGCVLA